MSRTRVVFIAFFVLATIASLRPLRDYDYGWQLAAGRWIHEHGALPSTDPFGVASDRIPWINGEWLFEYLLYPLHAAFGVNAIVFARALFIGALFTLLLAYVHRETKSLGMSLTLCAIAWTCATLVFSERPATFATGFAALAVFLALREPGWKSIAIYVALTILWINFHPSALLAPVIFVIPSVSRGIWRRGLSGAALSALALFANPYGLEGILAPQRLVRWVAIGPFTNREWQPSWPSLYPYLYVLIAIPLVAFAFDRERRKHLPHLLLAVFFAILAIRFRRNQVVFYAVWPLFVAPMIPPIASEKLRRVAAIGAFALMSLMLAVRPIGSGIDEHVLPVRATQQLVSLHPRGNIFAAGHFGGHLIWTFYPERRVVNDGRNELHHTFLAEYGAARRDTRAWRRLVDKYAITTAVADYEPTIPVTDPRTHKTLAVPASLAFYPRSRWALIAFDDAAMVFARRDAWRDRDLRAIEYEVLIPDDPSPRFAPAQRAKALHELARAHAILGDDSFVLARLGSAVAEPPLSDPDKKAVAPPPHS
ncbi:MAG TPA: hypothetical protein VMU84_18695 [Thermoanaerobaculia bacterium]|nr:hypothetical protein [Thermoanaerobaculia bacterium]